jgi:replication-associated recombination protein RarA
MYPTKTKLGYSTDEVISALQKCIRRGMEQHALFWAVELYNSGYDEWCWKRLRIMASEDVGLAEPHIPGTIHALYQLYIELKKKKDDYQKPERLQLTHAVLLLARAKKSRIVDNALIYFWQSHETDRYEIPDFALDKHTQRGRQMGRGIKHFIDEGSSLANLSGVQGEADYAKLFQKAVTTSAPLLDYGRES